uniref:NACHT and WD repeat domain-containing protein 2-like n=1 Tax=Seriola lalandi dorsalis TaxID=1841481 RepID=A0A3B4WL29_SERLL
MKGNESKLAKFVMFWSAVGVEVNGQRNWVLCVDTASPSPALPLPYIVLIIIHSVVERRALRESVFPKLREHCRNTLGVDVRVSIRSTSLYPFESSDPSRWPDEYTRQQLIKECRESSAGPFLLYGTAGLPTQVEVSEFQLLLQEGQQAGVGTLELERVYQRDENTIPPSYCLRPPHRDTCCAQVRSTSAKDEDLRKVFQTTVSLCVHNGLMTPERAHSYYRSALDADLRFALDSRPNDDIIRRCLVYVHKVINPEGEREKRQMNLQQQTQSETALTDGQLFSELCDNFLPGLITSRRLLVYTSTTECDHRHGYTTARRRSYAMSLCQQVYSDLVGLIDSWNMLDVREGFQLGDALAREQAEQEELCYTLSRLYGIIRPEEEEIRAYVEQSDQHCPLVVTGGPCTGKTVLLAEKVSDSNLNLSTIQCPDPRGPHSDIIKPDISLSELKECLSSLLSLLPSPKQPLVLILDGLDQIENNFICPQIIESLPSPLPLGAKLILTVSSSGAHILQAIKLQYPQCSPPRCVPKGSEKESGYVCVQLGLADRKECVKMLASLLISSGRRVTSGQQALVNQTSTFKTLSPSLFALSDSDVTESSLPDGVHASISALLNHLEQKHGSSIVARAVSYLTLSRTGLTEVELNDLLSSDDEVLSEYIQKNESPSSTMRVPQIDVERLLLDLRRFLIRRTFVRSRVLFWVSRHFKLVVAKRYLGTNEARREIHSEMADYFSGQWACGNAKPLLVNQEPGLNKDTVQAKIYIDRQPSNQPFVFTSLSKDAGQVNLRKVVELPYHLQQSGRWEELEHGLLMSLGFHQAMVRAGLLGDLVTMLEGDQGSSQFQFLRERQLLASSLKSSACLLQHTPLQLPKVMESSLLPYLEVFPVLEGYVREIRQERRKRGSGLGVALCPAPSSVPPIQCLKCDAKTKDVSVLEAAGTDCGIVALIMDDGSVWIWKGSGCDVVKVSLTCEQKELKFAGVKSSARFMLLSTQCNKLFLWDVTGLEMLLELKDPMKTEFEQKSSQKTLNEIMGFVGRQKKLFMWWKDESFVSVFNISSETFTHFQCQSSVTCLVCSSNGFYMYCGQEKGTVSIFDTDSSRLLGSCTNSNHNAVTSIILCEDKREMACVDRTGNVTVWDVAIKTQPPRLVKERFTGGKTDNILNTDYSKETEMLLVCQSRQVMLWDTCEWEIWDQFLAPKGRAFSQAVLSQDGHLFLALLDTCALVLAWRVSTGECVLSLEANKQPHTLLKMASDVICVARDGCLTVWDSEMIGAAGTAPKTGCGVKDVVVEQTGKWFYTSDGSEKVWRWSLETGFPHANFLHDGPVEKLCLSPDNIHLVTLSAEEVYVWQMETGQNILRISGTRATDILITPNSNFGVSISKRGLSQVWKLGNGSIVCSIHLYLSNAKVSPESTFLIGCHHGDLIAASLWSGSISKRFSCVESSEHVVAFHTLSEHPDFVVVMVASGAVYTWKVAEETVCRHFQLPYTFQCQPQDFQMSSNGNYALLSTDNDTINLLDLSHVRLCSFKADGPVIKACLDKTGCFAAYISLEKTCACDPLARPVLTVGRLMDGERVGSVRLSKNPLTLVVCKQQCVFVGFEDGSVGVYSVSDVMLNRKELVRCRKNLIDELKQCPLDRAPFSCRLSIKVEPMGHSTFFFPCVFEAC